MVILRRCLSAFRALNFRKPARSSKDGASGSVRVLAFDTAQGALSAALLDGQGKVLAHHFELRQRGHAEALLPLLEKVLRQAHLGPEDISALGVTIGPGTFTGLRAGLAAARGFALANKLPLIGVTTLEAVAEPVSLDENETLAVSFDARREEVYFQMFTAGLRILSEPQLLSVEAAVARLPQSKIVLVGTGAPLLQAELSPDRFRLSDTLAQPDALSVARLTLLRLAQSDVQSFRRFPSPLYLRAPDAKLPAKPQARFP